MYVSVFYITRNIFIIFPVFWGIGASWDVLINSPTGVSLLNSYSIIRAILVFLVMLIFSVLIKKLKVNENG